METSFNINGGNFFFNVLVKVVSGTSVCLFGVNNVAIANGVHWALIVQGNVALVIGATSLLLIYNIS